MRFLRVIWRYVLGDVLVHSLLGLFGITLLLVLGNVLRYLEDVAPSGEVISTLGILITAILPTFLPLVIPTALTFGVLMTLGRMSLDSEIIALRSSGISVRQMLPPILALASVAAVLTAYLQAEVTPRSYAQMKRLIREVGTRNLMLDPGNFREFGGRVFYYQASGGPECPMRGILISDETSADRGVFIAARCGRAAENEAADQLIFRLDDGSIYFSDASESRYRQMHFASMEMPLDLSAQISKRRWPREFTTRELIYLEQQPAQSEEWTRLLWSQLHGRVALALASIVLAIAAVPLGIRPLRAGRSAGALTASVLMGLYWVLTSAGERAAEEGYLPVALGIWIPNLIVLAAGLYLVRRSPSLES